MPDDGIKLNPEESHDLFGTNDKGMSLYKSIANVMAEIEDAQAQADSEEAGRRFMERTRRARSKVPDPMPPLDLGEFERYKVGVSLRKDGNQIQWLAFPNKLGARVTAFDYNGHYAVTPVKRNDKHGGWSPVRLPQAVTPGGGLLPPQALGALQRIANLPPEAAQAGVLR